MCRHEVHHRLARRQGGARSTRWFDLDDYVDYLIEFWRDGAKAHSGGVPAGVPPCHGRARMPKAYATPEPNRWGPSDPRKAPTAVIVGLPNGAIVLRGNVSTVRGLSGDRATGYRDSESRFDENLEAPRQPWEMSTSGRDEESADSTRTSTRVSIGGGHVRRIVPHADRSRVSAHLCPRASDARGARWIVGDYADCVLAIEGERDEFRSRPNKAALDWRPNSNRQEGILWPGSRPFPASSTVEMAREDRIPCSRESSPRTLKGVQSETIGDRRSTRD